MTRRRSTHASRSFARVVCALAVLIAAPPSSYLKRIYADSVVYTSSALHDSIETFGGNARRVFKL